MDSNRKAALSAGVLFITATVASLAGTALSGPIVNDPDRLTRAATNASPLIGGMLLQFVAAGASVGIAIALYPVLKQWGGGDGAWLGGLPDPGGGHVCHRRSGPAVLAATGPPGRERRRDRARRAAGNPLGAAGRPRGGSRGWRARFHRRRAALLLAALSIEAYSSLAVGLGNRGTLADDRGVRARPVRAEARDVVRGAGDPDRRAGDGPGAMADRQRVRLCCRSARAAHRHSDRACERAGPGRTPVTHSTAMYARSPLQPRTIAVPETSDRAASTSRRSGRLNGLPIKRDLAVAYRFSLAAAVLLAAVSAGGLAL